MDQSIDLSDEASADDWTIPKHQISKRRLIRRTPRHNIYKADWFGDVLLYEPIKNSKRIEVPSEEELVIQNNLNNSILDQDDLNNRLENLDLNSNKLSRSRLSLNSEFSDRVDSTYSSAHSSISSTPQYFTKQFKSEFEFPSESSTPRSTGSSESSFTNLKDIDEVKLTTKFSEIENKNLGEIKAKKEMSNSTNPVILNKDSYNFGYLFEEKHEENSSNNESKTSWFELNELRLVAHESFMLFMGVSLDETAFGSSQSTSLVMQMNQPKSSSLYNLLHATKISTSPIDRFFSTRQPHHSITINTKLNICQQVTNAMTYLHDKNIVHGKLTSVNIYLEPNQRVKISLIDNSTDFNLTSLTYFSPELIKTIKVSDGNRCDSTKLAHVQIDTHQMTKRSDIYSFGTFLFELYEEKFPFSDTKTDILDISTAQGSSQTTISPFASSLNSPLDKWNGNIKTSVHEIIFQIGSGLMEEKNLEPNTHKCPILVKEIISACWSVDPHERPSFKQLAFLFERLF